MWKDFLYFSKGQRVGIIVLFLLILLTLALNYYLPVYFTVRDNDDPGFQSEVESFRKSLVLRDSIRVLEWQRKNEERQRLFEERYKARAKVFPAYEKRADKSAYSLFSFDPNTIDSATFVKLGLKPYVASNIVKYRRKGGFFRTAADFARVYGVLPEKFKELQPFISISEVKQAKNEAALSAGKRDDIEVELNSADTTLLMQVKGIGRGSAKSIVRFRQATGGFVAVEQLQEVYGMRAENYERIKPHCTVNTALVQKIKINTASIDRLKSHPYIGFYKAKAIYELRRNKIKLKDIDELKNLSVLTTADIAKIKPYLSFE